MAFPVVKVEAAFVVNTTSAFVLNDPVKGVLGTAALSDEVWTDITAYANSFNTRRGATRAEGPVLRFEAGTMSILLDNSDRRFDPTNTASPYVSAGRSQVTPMRQIRITAEYGSMSYPIFTGYADTWEISYDGPSVSWCTLTATDATKVLADFVRGALAAPISDGETTGDRVHRVLDSVGWPVGQRFVDVGNSTVQGTTLEGDAWAELVNVQDAEIGKVYIDARGYVVFRQRSASMSITTPAAAFGDGVGELPFVDHTIEYDDQGLINVARIARAGGPLQVAQDTGSQTQYLTHTYERTDLVLRSDEDTANYASFVLYQSKEPELRFTQLRIAGNDDEVGLYPHILGREVGDLITLTRRPPGGGPVTTRRCFIIGISHDVAGPGEWRTTWALQSATKWDFMTLNSTTLGVLDTGVLAY